MRISLHDYATDPTLTQKDGVNLAHENIAALLRKAADTELAVSFHDFNRLLVDPAYARAVLGATDCVVSNVGPHAHYYFHLRETLGLDFRIFRDVRTALWSSYLLQEHLCQPFLRDQDVLLVASHYTRGIYEKLYPHLATLPTVRCYPLTVGFPATLPERPPAPGAHFTLGYIGRLSEDKNFLDIVALLIKLNRREPGRYRLLACGEVHSPSCDPQLIRSRLHQALGPGEHFEHLPPRVNGEVWGLYRRFDAMVFPSTSNLETLGRVLIEASYAGVPVICGAHAAAPELVPASSLCRVSYECGQTFSTHYDHSLGRVSIDDMVAVVADPELKASTVHSEYHAHSAKFIAALSRAARGETQAAEHFALSPTQANFISALQVTLPAALDRCTAKTLLSHLIPWFVDLQAKGSAAREQRLAQLLALSAHPERTRRFIAKSAATKCDFTNVGGIDIELCHIADFYPEFFLGAITNLSETQ